MISSQLRRGLSVLSWLALASGVTADTVHRLRLKTLVLVGVLLCGAGPSLLSADIVERFGLRHFPLGAAAVYSNEYGGLAIADLDGDPTNGVATELGEADSGAFIFPDKDSVSEGNFMTANAYGSVNGVADSLIGTIHGRRGSYATFYASGDYSAIGATSVTFQVWNGNLLIQQSTVSTGEVTMYAEYSQPPRVNPWWKQANGEFGASIEFAYTLPIALTSCAEDGPFVEDSPFVYGNRIFIRPDGATGVVDHVSRTDVFGGGGVDSFTYNNVQLGMFARPHTGLGAVKLVATNGVLKMDNLPPVPDLDLEDPAGVVVEFDHAITAEVHLLPLEIAVANTNEVQERVNLSGSGSWNNYVQFFGSAALENSNGVLRLSADFYANTNALTVYSNSVLVGTRNFFANEFVSITGAPRLTGVGANAALTSALPGLAFGFDAPATFHLPDGSTLLGDRAVVSTPELFGVADIVRVGIDTRVVPSFTIVNETSTSFTPSLKISREGFNVKLQWLDPAHAYSLQTRPNFIDAFDNIEISISYEDGIATALYNIAEDETSLGEAGNRFFRLFRYTSPY